MAKAGQRLLGGGVLVAWEAADKPGRGDLQQSRLQSACHRLQHGDKSRAVIKATDQAIADHLRGAGGVDGNKHSGGGMP